MDSLFYVKWEDGTFLYGSVTGSPGLNLNLKSSRSSKVRSFRVVFLSLNHGSRTEDPGRRSVLCVEKGMRSGDT